MSRDGGLFQGDETHLRLYTKFFHRDDGKIPFDGDAAEDWQVLRGGFRLDWQGKG